MGVEGRFGMEEEAAHRKEDDLRDEARLELVVDKALDDRLRVVRGVRGSLTSWELSCECHGVRKCHGVRRGERRESTAALARRQEGGIGEAPAGECAAATWQRLCGPLASRRDLIAGRMRDPTLHPTPRPRTLQAQARLKGGERRRTARPRAVPTGNTNDIAVSMISSASDLSASSCVGASTIAVVSSMAGSTSMAVDGARAAMAGCIAPTRMAAWKPATAGMLAATTSSASRSSMARMLGLGFLGEGR